MANNARLKTFVGGEFPSTPMCVKFLSVYDCSKRLRKMIDISHLSFAASEIDTKVAAFDRK